MGPAFSLALNPVHNSACPRQREPKLPVPIHQGRFATLSTEDYVYGADADKLTYINASFRFRGDEGRYLASLKARYAAPKAQVNTNTAYMLATQWLAAASVDVKSLERNCHVAVTYWDLRDGRFVPLYTVDWFKGDGIQEDVRNAATVEVLEPERLLHKLWVQDVQYIKSKPMVVPDRNNLLAETNFNTQRLISAIGAEK
jgi:hypothetical protein